MIVIVGAHPLQGPGDSVDNPRCAYSWVFECWHRAPGAKSRCGRRRSIECAGRKHVTLEDAIKEIERYGWRLGEDGYGWRCLEHVWRAQSAKERGA